MSTMYDGMGLAHILPSRGLRKESNTDAPWIRPFRPECIWRCPNCNIRKIHLLNSNFLTITNALLHPQFNFCSKCLNSLYSSTTHWLAFSRQLDGLGDFIKKNRTSSDSYGQSKCHVYSFRWTKPNSNMYVFVVCVCVCVWMWFTMGVWSGTLHKQLFCQFCLELLRCSLLRSLKWETVICWLSSHLLLF